MTSLKIIDFMTCKLIFEFESITEEGLKTLLSKYTNTFTIDNFYPDREIGCNRTTFAVVSIPSKIVQQLIQNTQVKELDPMTTFHKKMAGPECDGGGGCGGCGCG